MTIYKVTYEIDIDDKDLLECAKAYNEPLQDWEEDVLQNIQTSITVNRLHEWTKAHGIKRPKFIKSSIQYRDELANNQLITLRKE